ncbi:MAG: methylenetetrahydrofolate reductase, partial [Acinetobacter sp.]
MSKQIPISFEFFPTKTDLGAEKLKVVHQELQLLNPEFFSVTYGAGGSTRERT